MADNPELTDQDQANHSLVKGLKFLFAVLQIIIVILAIMLFRTGYFTVDQDKQVLAFANGAIVDSNGEARVFTSGQAHWVWPRPIGKTLALPADHVPLITETDINFWPNNKLRGKKKSSLVLGRDGYLISADQNLFHMRCRMTWQISNAPAFYRAFYSSEFTEKINEKEDVLLLNAAETSLHRLMQQAVITETAVWDIDSIFYSNVQGFQNALLQRCQKTINNAGIGIDITRIDIRPEDKTPPSKTANDFDSALRARVNAQKAFSEAQKEQSRLLTKASKQRANIVADAEVYRNRLVRRTETSSKKFLAFQEEFNASPDTALRAYYSNIITEILQSASARYMVYDPTNGTKQRIRLELAPAAVNARSAEDEND